MGKIYYKELPLFHLYDGDLTGTQKLLMTLLLVDRYDIYALSYLARMRQEDVTADLAELKRKGYLQDKRKPERNLRGGEMIPRNRAARNRVPASRMRMGLHGFLRSHTVPESRYPSHTKRASAAAFPADFGKTEYYTKQRSRFPETQTGFAVFITKIGEDFMSIRNEIKAQIVRAGFTMQELVDQLAEEYDWSDSVSNLSAKLQRESIRYKEVMELADVLGCDIVWQKRRDNR